MGPGGRHADGRIPPPGAQGWALKDADHRNIRPGCKPSGRWRLLISAAQEKPANTPENNMTRTRSTLNDLVAPIAFLSVASAWGYVALSYFASMFAT